MPTIRQRFDDLRRAMSWSWSDIDRITGRKNAATNITKRVPAWSHLAIEAREAYEARLQLHIVYIIRLLLGDYWILHYVAGGDIEFRAEDDPKQVIRLTFTPGTFSLSGSSLRIEGLLEQLAPLYPYSDQLAERTFRFSLLAQKGYQQTLEGIESEGAVLF